MRMPSVGADVLQQDGGEVFDMGPSGFLEAEVYLPVFAHLLDVAFHALSDLQGAEQFVLIEQAAVTVVYNDFETQVGLLPHQQADRVSGLVRGLLLREVMFHFGRGHDTETLFIQMDVDHVSSAYLHLALLFAEGDKEVFHQPPVQESAVLIDPRYFQTGKFAYLRQRGLGGGHQALFVVKVYKYVQLVARLATLGHIAGGQQDFPFLASVQVKAETDFFHDLQRIESS